MLPTRALSWKVWAVLLCGIVLVAGGSAYLYVRTDPPRGAALCTTSNNKPLCYSTIIEEILRSEGIPAAFDALAAAYDTDPDFAGACHAVTHELGDAAYDEFEKTGETELSRKPPCCGYGFYHGFMDALYVETNDMEKARSFCAYVGENVPHPPSAEFAEGSCYHGIGHGVTDGTDPRAWGSVMAIVKPGLALCSKVAPANDEWHMRCASGVFNALGNMYADPKFKLTSDPDPYALCRTGPFLPVERKACYNQMNTEAAARGNNNLAAIVGYTNAIQDSDYRSVALQEAVSLLGGTSEFKRILYRHCCPANLRARAARISKFRMFIIKSIRKHAVLLVGLSAVLLGISFFVRAYLPVALQSDRMLARSEVEVCTASTTEKQKELCYEKNIPRLMDQGLSMERTFAVVRLVQDIDPGYQSCHVQIGR